MGGSGAEAGKKGYGCGRMRDGGGGAGTQVRKGRAFEDLRGAGG